MMKKIGIIFLAGIAVYIGMVLLYEIAQILMFLIMAVLLYYFRIKNGD